MAFDPPHSSHEPGKERRWDRFLRAKDDDPRLKHAEHAHSFEEFRNAVNAVDPGMEQDTLWKYWQEVDPSKAPLPSHHAAEEHSGQGTHEQEHPKGGHGGHKSFTEKVEEGLIPGVANLLRKPKFMEQDKEFWNLMEQEQKTWTKENKKPGRRASKEEKAAYDEKYTNFYYGSLEADANTTDGKSLEERTKDKLRAQYESETYTDKKGNVKQKSERQKKKDLDKLKRYEENEGELKKKITRKSGFFGRKETPIKFDEDSDVWKTKQKISSEAGARYALLKHKGLKGDDLDQSYKAIMKRLQEKHWKDFAEKFPEKAEHFAKEDYKTKTFKKRLWEKTNTRQEYEDQKRATFDAFRRAQEEKLKAQEASGIVDRGKVHRDKDALTAQQAADRLQALAGQPPPQQTSSQLIVPQSNRRPTAAPPTPSTPVQPAPSPAAQQASQQRINRLAAILHRFSQQQKQTASSSQQQQKGIFSRTIDTANDVYNKYKSAKDFYNFGRTLFQGSSQAATAAEGATVAAEGVAAAEGAAAAGSAAATGAAATGAAAGGTAAAAGATAAAGAGAAATGAAAAGGSAAAGGAAAGGVIAGGWLILVIILIIIILIFIIYIIAQILGGSNTTNTSQTIPGLTLRLEGPNAVPNSTNIQYKIIATYTGTADITLSDPLPADTTFVSATGNYSISFGNGGKNTVTWKLKDNQVSPDVAQSGIAKNYIFELVLHPDKNDSIVRNRVFATTSGGGLTLPPNPNDHDFETLMKGQGRNIGVLGDENSFTTTILSRGESRLANKEREIRQAYQAAVAKNVNPLILISDWGLESGFDTTGRLASMGCGIYVGVPNDFTSQVNCAAKTWDYWMTDFEKKAAANGIPVNIPSEKGTTCNYDDPFLYAAEWYGPVCHADDSNEHFHSAFYKFYKMFLGQ